jgi:hypothetical protein
MMARVARLTFESVEPISREVALARLRELDGLTRARALVSLAYHDPDWRWVQDLCLRLLNDPDVGMRGIAVLCLGHLARIHGQLDLTRVLPALRRLRDDEEVSARVADAIDDINTFVIRRSR